MAHELETRMRAMEVGQATLTQVVTDNTTIVSALLTKHDKTIYGTEANPGLVTRLDREEQNTVRAKKSFWIFFTALIGIIGKFVYDGVAYLFNHPH